jgi:shikimate kinase
LPLFFDILNHMKLLLIHGPPASGKLTIAEKISEITGIPLFHNHQSRDIVKDIYGEKLKEHYDLVEQIRFDVLEYCAKHDTDLIFTVVYESEDDEEIFKKNVEQVEKHGGQVLYVALTASAEDLINRVENDSRKQFKKLTSRAIMEELVKDMSVFDIPFVDSFTVNTSENSAEEAARLIIENFNLEVTR